jgi:glycosyltransferase involved in cell wall biosynthesis
MGGTVRTTLNTASRLARTHEVELLAVARTRDQPFFDFPPGVTVTTIDDRRSTVPRGRVRRALERCPSVLFTRADHRTRSSTLWTDVMLARTLRRRRAGVLIGTRPGLNLVAAHVAPPSLVRVGQEHMHLSAHRPSLRSAIAAAYRKLDAVVVLTEADRADYTALLGGSVRVECIPNAVSEVAGAAPDLSARTVLAAGRLKRQKDFGRLIRAFAHVAERHPDWDLRICGGGPRRRGLGRLIAELGLGENVVLTGRVRNLGDEMASASIYALSSRREGFPMVLLEAMSKGLPVVSFDCPTGPRELVRDRENGLLVPHQDVRALAAAINEMIEDEELRRRCGAGARATASEYSIEAIGARWEELLEELGAPDDASPRAASHRRRVGIPFRA